VPLPPIQSLISVETFSELLVNIRERNLFFFFFFFLISRVCLSEKMDMKNDEISKNIIKNANT